MFTTYMYGINLELKFDNNQLSFTLVYFDIQNIPDHWVSNAVFAGTFHAALKCTQKISSAFL